MGVAGIGEALDLSDFQLSRAEGFDGTVNMSDVTQLQDIVSSFNDTIMNEILPGAESAFQRLEELAIDVGVAWSRLNNLTERAQELLNSLPSLATDLNVTEGGLTRIKSRYNALRQELSQLDYQANTLSAQLRGVARLLSNSTTSLTMGSESLSSIRAGIYARLSGLELGRAEELNTTVTRVMDVAVQANTRAQQLMSSATNTLTMINTTLERVLVSLQTIATLESSLVNSKATLEDVVSQSSLPLERARSLATAINATVLPDEFIQEITTNASTSHNTALAALATAQSAM